MVDIRPLVFLILIILITIKVISYFIEKRNEKKFMKIS